MVILQYRSSPPHLRGSCSWCGHTFSLMPVAKDTSSKGLLQKKKKKKNDLMCQLAMRKKKGQSKETNPWFFHFNQQNIKGL